VGAASWTWFGGMYRQEEGVSFPNMAIEPDAVGIVWPDWHIEPATLAEFARRRDGAIVGRLTMRRYGWKPGDRITLVGKDWRLDLSLVIVGEIPIDRAPHLLFQREYLAQAISPRGWQLDTTGTIWLRVDDPDRVGPLMQEIDDAFRNSEAQTASETEKSF